MTVLLEWKEKIRGFYGKHRLYLLPAMKFLLAFLVFGMINAKTGYMQRLNNIPLLLILALACSILPASAMLLAAGTLAVLHCYALSLPAGVVMLVLFVIMYLLYFRFAPKYAYNALLMPAAYLFGIPYVMPVASGLLQTPAASLPACCGMITYYFLNGITANATKLAVTAKDEPVITKFQEIIKQFSGNREMYLSVAAVITVTLMVYLIRRLPIDHAWTFAIGTGILVQFLAFVIGYMQLGMKNKTVVLAAGCAVSAAILIVIQFFCFNLDYVRTERVQFEDDEYYYYVKAVPKRYVSTSQKTVKTIHKNNRNKKTQPDMAAHMELLKDIDMQPIERK